MDDGGDEACPVGLQVAQGEQPLVLQPVGRTPHSKRSTIDDMRIDHLMRPTTYDDLHPRREGTAEPLGIHLVSPSHVEIERLAFNR